MTFELRHGDTIRSSSSVVYVTDFQDNIDTTFELNVGRFQCVTPTDTSFFVLSLFRDTIIINQDTLINNIGGQMDRGDLILLEIDIKGNVLFHRTFPSYGLDFDEIRVAKTGEVLFMTSTYSPTASTRNLDSNFIASNERALFLFDKKTGLKKLFSFHGQELVVNDFLIYKDCILVVGEAKNSVLHNFLQFNSSKAGYLITLDLEGNVTGGFSFSSYDDSDLRDVDMYEGKVYVGGNGLDTSNTAYYAQLNPAIFNSNKVTARICTGDSFLFSGNWLKRAGVYVDTLKSSQGLDSLVTLSLAVAGSDNYINLSGCFPDVIWYNSKTYTNSKRDTFYFKDQWNCDSTIYLNIQFYPTYFTRDTVNLCIGDSVLVNGKWQKEEDILNFKVRSVNGCDSSVQAAVLYNNRRELYLRICHQDTFHYRGQAYVNPRMYNIRIPDTSSCDSVLILHLQNHPINPRQIVKRLDTLFVSSRLRNIQWHFNGVPITGASDTSHLALVSGNYFYTADDFNGCSDTSNVVWHTPVGLQGMEEGIRVFPNPAAERVHISGLIEGTRVEVLNMLGQILFNVNAPSTEELEIELSGLRDGVYFINFYSRKKTIHRQQLIIRK